MEAYIVSTMDVCVAIRELRDPQGSRYTDIMRKIRDMNGDRGPEFLDVQPAIRRARREGLIEQNQQTGWWKLTRNGRYFCRRADNNRMETWSEVSIEIKMKWF